MDEDQTQVETTDAVVETIEKVAKPAIKEPKIRDQKDAILELRRENEKLRKTLDEQSSVRAEELANIKLEELRASTEAKAHKNAEKLVEDRLKAMEEASRARLVKSELRAHAMKAGVVDFDDLYEIIKKSDLKTLVEFDEDGEVTNASEIVSTMKQKKAHLFAGVSNASNERSPVGRVAPTLNVREMPDAEFDKLLLSMGVHAK